MTRSNAREKAMIILYQIDINKENNIAYDLNEIISDNTTNKYPFLQELVMGVINDNEQLNDLANEYLKDWKINRLDKLGAIILKMALYELKMMDTPKVVVINEAINLAKKYCDIELAKMINATLDNYIKKVKVIK